MYLFLVLLSYEIAWNHLADLSVRSSRTLVVVGLLLLLYIKYSKMSLFWAFSSCFFLLSFCYYFQYWYTSQPWNPNLHGQSLKRPEAGVIVRTPTSKIGTHQSSRALLPPKLKTKSKLTPSRLTAEQAKVLENRSPSPELLLLIPTYKTGLTSFLCH